MLLVTLSLNTNKASSRQGRAAFLTWDIPIVTRHKKKKV